MKMKKIVGILMIVALLGFSGGALAQEWNVKAPGGRPPGGGKFGRPGPAFEQRDELDKAGRLNKRFDRGRDKPRREIPQAIQNKINESRKLADDMHAELRKTPFNRTRVLQLRDKSLRLRREVSDWFFTQRLDEIEKERRDQKIRGN